MGEWISVNDRLPEDGQRVLCCLPFGEMVIAWYSEISQMWHAIGYIANSLNVKYWQPLPKPPKED